MIVERTPAAIIPVNKPGRRTRFAVINLDLKADIFDRIFWHPANGSGLTDLETLN
jgi:hypothetical protein